MYHFKLVALDRSNMFKLVQKMSIFNVRKNSKHGSEIIKILPTCIFVTTTYFVQKNALNVISMLYYNSEQVGHCSIVDKSSAYSAKEPGFTSQWRQEFINKNCMFCSFEKNKAPVGANL